MCFVLQVNESMAVNSHNVSSNAGHTVLQKAEPSTWKNELVRMISILSYLYFIITLLLSSPPPSLTYIVFSSHNIFAVS